jgi:hypothetical protein
VPELKSKEQVPDLNLGAVRATVRPSRDDKNARITSAGVEVHAERAFLRRLSEGKFKATVTVEHPYLIPPSISVPERELELTRGSFAEIHVAFERLGGMVKVQGAGKAARLSPEEGSPIIRPVADGTAAFPGTPPGRYRVELCADAECSAATATWKDVIVRAARTTFVP